jgi:acylphosphatase
MAEELGRVNLLITGQVQGVFYRASCMEQAQSLNLTGTVTNLAGGEVEVTAEGEKYSLEQLVEWCRRGPPDAHVEDVIVRWQPYKAEFRTFMVAR